LIKLYNLINWSQVHTQSGAFVVMIIW